MLHQIALIGFLALGGAMSHAQTQTPSAAEPVQTAVEPVQTAAEPVQPAASEAAKVSLSGRLGNKVLLIIDGQRQTMSPGDTRTGVKLISVGANDVIIEVAGRRQTLTLDGPPATTLNGRREHVSADKQITLTAGTGGNFFTLGFINGYSVEFMVDEAAATVTLSQQEADRIGLDWRKGRPVSVQTQSGQVTARLVSIEVIRIQGVEAYGVEATVLPTPMRNALLGENFLTLFQVKQGNDNMTLNKKR
jgi:aspartyl protease family protein